MQLGTLTRLQNREDDHADERTYELRQCGEEVEYAEIDTCRFTRRTVGRRAVVIVSVEMIEAQERGRGCGRGEVNVIRKTAVGRAVCEHWGGESVYLYTQEGEGSPTGKGPGYTAQGNQDGRHFDGTYKRGEAHCACKYEVTELPGSYEIGFAPGQDCKERCEAYWWAGCEWRAVLVRGSDDEWEEDRGHECNRGEDDER